MPRDIYDSGRRASFGMFIAMSFVWLAAWNWIHGAVAVWAVMFLVYVFSLALVMLLGLPAGRSSVFDEWRVRFIRTGGILIVSGVLSGVYLIVIGLVLVMIGGGG